ncbi:MAG: hypothetical protein Kow0069_16830 [Promethearchaeota archaeon]
MVDLYLFGHGARQGPQLDRLLTLVREQAGSGESEGSVVVVLAQDAVVGVQRRGRRLGNLQALLDSPAKVYALTPDLQARGLDPSNVDPKVNLASYDELVDLLVDASRVHSWL